MTGSAPQRWTLRLVAGGSSEGRESEGWGVAVRSELFRYLADDGKRSDALDIVFKAGGC